MKFANVPRLSAIYIDIASYIGENNLENSDRFLFAAEETFQQLGQMPQLGKQCQFSNYRLQNIRQIAVKGFRKYLVFYQIIATGVEIIRVIHGSQDIERILEEDSQEDI